MQVSIRARIFLMALIPILGFSAVGIAVWLGSLSMAGSMDVLTQSQAAFARATQLQVSLSVMQRAERDLRITRQSRFADEFKALALEAHKAALGMGEQSDVGSLSAALDRIDGDFANALKVRTALGIVTVPGAEGAVNDAADAVGEAIDSITTMGAGDGGVGDLRRIFQTMRDAERDFARTLDPLPLQALDRAQGDFDIQLKTMAIPPGQRKSVAALKTAYGVAQQNYAALLVNYRKASDVLNADIAALAPQVKTLAASVQMRMAAAQDDVANTSRRTTFFVTAAIVLSLVLCVSLAWVTGRGIIRPLLALAESLNALAGKNYERAVPDTQRGDEIGEMAKSVDVLKASMIEGDHLVAVQAEEHLAKEQRADRLGQLIATFEARVTQVIDAIGKAGSHLHATAESLANTSLDTTQRATLLTQSAGQASSNVRSVAAATEEMSASIGEIGDRVSQSTALIGQAVEQTNATDVQVQSLSDAAKAIGNVVKLINDIAGQTNLLALNATIEAARAGEAGKGFAVVATEVKQLANQTAKATEQVTAQIETIQNASQQSIDAMQQITKTISSVSEISGTIAAAIHQQATTTRAISQEVSEASDTTLRISATMETMSQAAHKTGAAAANVLSSAEELTQSGQTLRREVEQFLGQVRAV